MGCGLQCQAYLRFVWLPPHLFVYIMATLNGLLIAGMARSSNLRRWFGAGFRVPFVPFEIPGAFFILGGGFVSLGLRWE